MYFDFTDEQKSFQKKVCDFLDKEVTSGVIDESESGLGFGTESWNLMRKLGERKWLAVSFPRDYGGLGLSRVHSFIVRDELDYRDALVVVKGVGLIGVDMAGPVIMKHGSKELKENFLPRIAAGEIEFALGYTEPDAGSDLSRIEMWAVEDGDDFVVTGQKLFNTCCHFAQYHWLAVKTERDRSAQKGLSLMIVDLRSPGITISPMWEMSDTRTNVVFYDSVRVPKRFLVGEVNRGWDYMVSALNFERMFVTGGLRRVLEDLIAYVKSKKSADSSDKDLSIRHELAEMEAEISIAHSFAVRVACLQDKGVAPSYESAALKLFVSELYQRIANLGLEILKPYGCLRRDSKYAVLNGRMERLYRSSFLLTIGAGTSEIMRNTIATKGLRLPR